MLVVFLAYRRDELIRVDMTFGDGGWRARRGAQMATWEIDWKVVVVDDDAKSVMDLPALPNRRGYREHRGKGRARGRSWQRPLVGGGEGDANDGARNRRAMRARASRAAMTLESRRAGQGGTRGVDAFGRVLI
jgi:hypothetical protein